MEIKGRIIAAMERRSGTSSKGAWVSQDFVVETTDEQYAKKCLFNVFGEDKLNEYSIQVGDAVTVSFDINAREYNGKWYNDVRAWRVLNHSNEQRKTMAAPSVTAAPAPASIPPPTVVPPASADGLPF
jgi:hypothetical protein